MNGLVNLEHPGWSFVLMLLIHFAWQAAAIGLLWRCVMGSFGKDDCRRRYNASLVALAALCLAPVFTGLWIGCYQSPGGPSWARSLQKNNGSADPRSDTGSAAAINSNGAPSHDAISKGAMLKRAQPNEAQSNLAERDMTESGELTSNLPVPFPGATVVENPSTAEVRPHIEPRQSPADLQTGVPSVATRQPSSTQYETSTATGHRPSPGDRISNWLMSQQRWLLLAWLTGATLLSLRLSVSACACLKLRKNRHRLPEAIGEEFAPLAARLNMPAWRRLIFTSGQVTEAVAVGVMRPIVLVPASWVTQLSPQILQAILAHELAHIRRHDLLVNLVQRIVEMLFFFHPLVWWLSAALRYERERCCDQVAVDVTGDRVAYARALAEAARLRMRPIEMGLVASILGGKKMALLRRVRTVLDATPSRRRSPLGSVVGFVVLGLVGTWTTLTVFGTQDDQDRPPQRQRDDRQDGDRARDADRATDSARTRDRAQDGDRARDRADARESQPARSPDRRREVSPRERQGDGPRDDDRRFRDPRTGNGFQEGRDDGNRNDFFRRDDGERRNTFRREFDNGDAPQQQLQRRFPDRPIESRPNPDANARDPRQYEDRYFDGRNNSIRNNQDRNNEERNLFRDRQSFDEDNRAQSTPARVQDRVNVEMLQLIRELHNEVRELRREVADLRRTVDTEPRQRGIRRNPARESFGPGVSDSPPERINETADPNSRSNPNARRRNTPVERPETAEDPNESDSSPPRRNTQSSRSPRADADPNARPADTGRRSRGSDVDPGRSNQTTTSPETTGGN